jgi:hypothetical protein
MEIGFYWVKVPKNYDGEIKWEIAFYSGEEDEPFQLCGNEIGFDESFFLDIDKNQIKRTI